MPDVVLRIENGEVIMEQAPEGSITRVEYPRDDGTETVYVFWGVEVLDVRHLGANGVERR